MCRTVKPHVENIWNQFLISPCLILWQFPLPSVVLYATHQENKRLFGFVLRTSGGRVESRQTSVCYIFESNNEGEKVLVMVLLVSVLSVVWIPRP